MLLKDAIKPNLVQTLEGQPAFVHCGPFANIAHGNNSLVADRVGLKLGEYLVTESGFASDMGMEKFFDITCRIGDLRPSAVVLVATVRALKHHGGNIDGGAAEIEEGAANLARHIGIIRHFGLQAVVGVNKFPTDTQEELELVKRLAVEHGAYAAEINTAFEDGGKGAAALAEAVVAAADEPSEFRFAYAVGRADRGEDPRDRDGRLRRRRGRSCSRRRRTRRRAFEASGLGDLPICMAKTHLSLSHDATLLNAPTGFTVTVRDLRPYTGAGLDRRAVRRHADDAGPREDARGARHRRRRGRRAPSACSDLALEEVVGWGGARRDAGRKLRRREATPSGMCPAVRRGSPR